MHHQIICGTMIGLKHRFSIGAEVPGERKTTRTQQHGTQVGKHVAEEVGRYAITSNDRAS